MGRRLSSFLKALVIFWAISAAYVFYDLLKHDGVRLSSRFYYHDTDDRSRQLRERNRSDEICLCSLCLQAHRKQNMLIDAWPRMAVPGDVGYGGSGITINKSLLTEIEQVQYDNGYSSYKINLLASDKLPLRRNITLDMPECKNMSYDTSSMPTVGIVLIFIDEAWSVLIRTIFSILDAGPTDLITEIVLVDDASQKEHLRKPLEDFIKIFGGKVKLVRQPHRSGLIAARLIGFQHVTGDVVAFLDAHTEVPKGWLEPLLHRIKEDPSVVAVPQTDVVNYKTFQYEFTSNMDHQICGFQFDMRYSWMKAPPLDGIKRKTLADPIETPVHMGCCFATMKSNFDRLGRYDPELQIWGCENLDLSFKTWMCGGRLEIIPCSHIAHMYRPTFPYSWTDKKYLFERNCLRVAEVWMDQYKEFYHDRIADIRDQIDLGDITQQKAQREKLQCHSFQWYIDKVYPSLYVPVNTSAMGKIASIRDPSLCIMKEFSSWNRIEHQSEAKPSRCSSFIWEQYLYLTKEKQIRLDEYCLVYHESKQIFRNEFCEMDKQKWEYTKENTIHLLDTSLCIALSSDNSKITMSTCNTSDISQQWSWSRRSITIYQEKL